MKETFETVKEISKNPRGRALLFFGFYFIVFAVLIFFIREASHNNKPTDEFESGRPYSFNTNKLLNHNFQFHYTVTLDDKVYEYSGDRYNDMEQFQYNKLDYFRNKDAFFVNEKTWIKSDNPYVYYDFINVDNIIDLIGISTYESKTSYNNGKTNYNFLISSNTLNKVINETDTDFFEDPNKIFISTDENKDINNIILYLDSYCLNNKLCNKSLKIELEYDKYGEIKEIESPIQ